MGTDTRWKYLDDANPLEREHREKQLRLIDQWWEEFSARADDLDGHFSGKVQWELTDWVQKHLQAVDPRLMWEFGPALHCKGHRLVITPEAEIHLRPLTDTLLARAPRLPGWEFYDARVPEDLQMARETVRSRTGGDISDMVVRVERGPCNRIDLTFLSPKIASSQDSQAREDAFVATETLLGERVLDRWIGGIEVAAFETGSLFLRWLRKQPRVEETVNLDRLKSRVDAMISLIREGLPAEPYHCFASKAEWTLLKLKPSAEPDYPGQTDLFVAKTASVPLWEATHAAAFFDERFSRHGETFGYVKIDGSEGLRGEFRDKSEIEDALTELLEPHGLGTQVGGGTGRRYSYVDLALTRVDEAIAAIRDRLRAGAVPSRSWIQFFGADLGREWVGIYPDTPAPPM